jgi:RHS repeat-associated protein
VLKATDSSQTLVWDAERRPFGERTVSVEQIEVPLGFPGQYYDQESNDYYNYFRDYDPATGRYLQSDPIGLDGGINTYTYVDSNPITRIDPTGEIWFLAFAGAGGTAAGGTATAGGISWGTAALGGIGLGVLMSTPGDTDQSRERKKKGVEAWNKNPPKMKGQYTCRYVMYFPADLCESGDCPPWVTGRGYDVTLSGAMSQARTEAQNKIPAGCGHQHHGQMWCRNNGGPPFMP